MTDRFDVNNKELNKRRFQDQNINVFKAKQGKNKGAKFVNQEISFSLTP